MDWFLYGNGFRHERVKTKNAGQKWLKTSCLRDVKNFGPIICNINVSVHKICSFGKGRL